MKQAEARLERGKILHKQRNYRAAVAELQRAVDLNPQSKQVLHTYPATALSYSGLPDRDQPHSRSLLRNAVLDRNPLWQSFCRRGMCPLCG